MSTKLRFGDVVRVIHNPNFPEFDGRLGEVVDVHGDHIRIRFMDEAERRPFYDPNRIWHYSQVQKEDL